jgi:serine/threonine-protein kinase
VLVDTHLGILKLADFGTNRRLDALQAHSYAGTANWQAPEQFFPAAGGGYTTGMYSDYFALGALFYFLATGGLHLRYCGDCGTAYRDHHTAGAGVLRQRHDGALPRTLQTDEEMLFARAFPATAAEPALLLLRRLLDADPAGRPRHVVEISRQLAAIAAEA